MGGEKSSDDGEVLTGCMGVMSWFNSHGCWLCIGPTPLLGGAGFVVCSVLSCDAGWLTSMYVLWRLSCVDHI